VSCPYIGNQPGRPTAIKTETIKLAIGAKNPGNSVNIKLTRQGKTMIEAVDTQADSAVLAGSFMITNLVISGFKIRNRSHFEQL